MRCKHVRKRDLFIEVPCNKSCVKEEQSSGPTPLCTVQELNVALFSDKVNFKEYVPVCSTSAISGDGMRPHSTAGNAEQETPSGEAAVL